MSLPAIASANPATTIARALVLDAKSAALELPRSIIRLSKTPFQKADRVPAFSNAVLGIGLGTICWLILLLAVPNTVRNWLYGAFNPDGYQTAWGGPSLAGAWAVHAAIATALLPVYAAILHGLVGLRQSVSNTFSSNGNAKPLNVIISIIVVLAGFVFLAALIRQA